MESDLLARDFPASALDQTALSLVYLQAELTWLDVRLRRLIRLWQLAGQNPADPFRGLYITDQEADDLADQPAGVGWIGLAALSDEEQQAWEAAEEQALLRTRRLVEAASAQGERVRLLELAAIYGLDEFELGVVLIALAPELDLRYERLYAYLQDDVTKKRPTVNLTLALLCRSLEEKITRRSHFAADAPLLRQDLIELIPDPSHPQPPLLAHYLKLDDQIVAFLLDQAGMDRRLAPFCQVIQPSITLDDLSITSQLTTPLRAMAVEAWNQRQLLTLCLHGSTRGDRLALVEALAGELGAVLLTADLGRALEAAVDFDLALKLAFREALLQDALLCLEGLDMLCSVERGASFERLQDALATAENLTILSNTIPWTPTGRHALGVVNLPLEPPGFTQRWDIWREHLAAANASLDSEDAEALASRFRLTPTQIGEAVGAACQRAQWRSAAQAGDGDVRPTLDDLLAGARAQAGHDLERLASKIEPVYTWEDIVLPADALALLHEICQRVAYRHQVMDKWGFERKLSLGKGVTVLFAGPSGTGKTMAAEVIANALGLDLYKIDLSGVVSKYIGETEKNLERIFSAAENANAILFFDEADALFGKRSEVRDSHDRYANIEISYLLQKMEAYDGIAILATNLRQNLDEAFVRRLAYTVHFPFPDEDSRRRIWQGIWPAELPLGQDVDLDFLALQFKLSGGNIRNIALAASFLAAQDGRLVSMAHLRHATRREYQKLGKMLSEEDLAGEKVRS